MKNLKRYIEALRCIPPPGGNGCHQALLGAANLGIIAGLDPEQIHADIRQAIPPGRRCVGDREIQDAINKALSDHRGRTFTPKPRPKPVVSDGRAVLRRIIDQAEISTEVDLWELSPVRLWEAP